VGNWTPTVLCHSVSDGGEAWRGREIEMKTEQIFKLLVIAIKLNSLAIAKIQALETILKLMLPIILARPATENTSLHDSLKGIANSDHLTMTEVVRKTLLDFAEAIQNPRSCRFEGVYVLDPSKVDEVDSLSHVELMKEYNSILEDISKEQEGDMGQ
jgi:hypothetical protein